MILKLRIWKFRITFTFARVIDVVGVNSRLPNGNHILMWDFDDVKLMDVIDALNEQQKRYNLSQIYILETTPNKNYIAYCFTTAPFFDACKVIITTRGVCRNFVKFGVIRGHFTLRVSPKCGRKPKLVTVIPSLYPPDVTVKDLHSWVIYETLPDDVKRWMLRLGYERNQ